MSFLVATLQERFEEVAAGWALSTVLPLNEFSAPGAVRVPYGSDVRFKEHISLLSEWAIFKTRLQSNYRVQNTPQNGLCGAWAVWAGVRALFIEQGWICPHFQAVHDWFGSRGYREFITQNAARFGMFNDMDFRHQSWFTICQLDALAMWLGKECGGPATCIKIMFVNQEFTADSQRKRTHMIVAGQIPDAPGQHLIFVHWQQTQVVAAAGGDLSGHYSAICPQAIEPNALPIGEWNVLFNAFTARVKPRPSPQGGVKKSKDQPACRNRNPYTSGLKSALINKDVNMWVSGELLTNPCTGQPGRIRNPMTNERILEFLGSSANPSAVAQRLMVDREKHSQMGLPLSKRPRRGTIAEQRVKSQADQVRDILQDIQIPRASLTADYLQRLQGEQVVWERKRRITGTGIPNDLPEISQSMTVQQLGAGKPSHAGPSQSQSNIQQNPAVSAVVEAPSQGPYGHVNQGAFMPWNSPVPDFEDDVMEDVEDQDQDLNDINDYDEVAQSPSNQVDDSLVDPLLMSSSVVTMETPVNQEVFQAEDPAETSAEGSPGAKISSPSPGRREMRSSTKAKRSLPEPDQSETHGKKPKKH